MHMADALVSPAVGGTLWAASAGLIGYSCKMVKASLDDRRVPLMGVMAAFTFAAQMVNVAIPGTGSSGHLGGGLLLAVLLGPHAAFLTMTSVLIIQAVFFADGGLLALGCNLFNMGAIPCFVAYPLIYRRLVRPSHARPRYMAASLTAAIVALQLGAASVVLETRLSGVAELPLVPFALLMQPIHLAIGVMEGLATAAVVLFIAKARPELLQVSKAPSSSPAASPRAVVAVLATLALVIAGGVSLLASSLPDGLEWAVARVAGSEDVGGESAAHHAAAGVQTRTALLPDYSFASPSDPDSNPGGEPATSAAGTSAAGIVGGVITLVLAGALGFVFRRRRREAGVSNPEAPA